MDVMGALLGDSLLIPWKSSRKGFHRTTMQREELVNGRKRQPRTIESLHVRQSHSCFQANMGIYRQLTDVNQLAPIFLVEQFVFLSLAFCIV